MKISRKVFALFLLSLLAIILTTSFTLQAEEILPMADWPMFRHDPQHSGNNSCGAPITGSVLWETNIGLPIYSSPAIASGKEFFGVNGQVLALDARTGKTIWKAPMAGEIYSSPAVDPKAWKAGLVYIASYGSRSSTLSALDMNTGALCWWTWMTTKSSPTVVQNPPILISSLIYPPIPRATVYIGSGDYLLALDADTGKELWRFLGTGVIDSTPAVDEQNVYFGTNANWFYAVNRYTGKLVWNFATKGAISSSPSVGPKLVVFGDTAGYVFFLDKVTGSIIKYYITPGPITSSPAYTPGSIDPSPAENAGAIYIASSSGPDSASGSILFKFSESGLPIWKVPVPGQVHSSPAVAAGRVYIGSQGSKSSAIFCFNATTGAQHWYKWMMMYSSPSIANNFLYVTTLDGMAYCLLDWL
ncbi:MAG TPA: PQQ-binding-like beta-propeller repeat protein [Bacillota bacterium]|nr:PQQ-binding-like beta-propeller repeat protein [Bacillota bacterium]